MLVAERRSGKPLSEALLRYAHDQERSTSTVGNGTHPEQRAVQLGALMGVSIPDGPCAEQQADERTRNDVARPMLVEIDARQSRHRRSGVEQWCGIPVRVGPALSNLTHQRGCGR